MTGGGESIGYQQNEFELVLILVFNMGLWMRMTPRRTVNKLKNGDVKRKRELGREGLSRGERYFNVFLTNIIDLDW